MEHTAQDGGGGIFILSKTPKVHTEPPKEQGPIPVPNINLCASLEQSGGRRQAGFSL